MSLSHIFHSVRCIASSISISLLGYVPCIQNAMSTGVKSYKPYTTAMLVPPRHIQPKFEGRTTSGSSFVKHDKHHYHEKHKYNKTRTTTNEKRELFHPQQIPVQREGPTQYKQMVMPHETHSTATGDYTAWVGARPSSSRAPPTYAFTRPEVRHFETEASGNFLGTRGPKSQLKVPDARGIPNTRFSAESNHTNDYPDWNGRPAKTFVPFRGPGVRDTRDYKTEANAEFETKRNTHTRAFRPIPEPIPYIPFTGVTTAATDFKDWAPSPKVKARPSSTRMPESYQSNMTIPVEYRSFQSEQRGEFEDTRRRSPRPSYLNTSHMNSMKHTGSLNNSMTISRGVRKTQMEGRSTDRNLQVLDWPAQKVIV
jgi:hypothetical protein